MLGSILDRISRAWLSWRWHDLLEIGEVKARPCAMPEGAFLCGRIWQTESTGPHRAVVLVVYPRASKARPFILEGPNAGTILLFVDALDERIREHSKRMGMV